MHMYKMHMQPLKLDPPSDVWNSFGIKPVLWLYEIVGSIGANVGAEILASEALNMKIVVAAPNRWTSTKLNSFCEEHQEVEVYSIHEPSELTYDLLRLISPDYVFFPHWSWRIPHEIYGNFPCVVFHPSDLPFGRGGSPVQNLIAIGVQTTKISAIEVVEEMDAGGVLLKRELSLLGTGEEIYLRMQDTIFDDMIPFILKHRPVPVPQRGEVTVFKRRNPTMSRMTPDMSLRQIFDTIRMLDAEGYPYAFIEIGELRFTFTRASMKTGEIRADVVITKQEVPR